MRAWVHIPADSVPGVYVEFGVLRGDTFVGLARAAQKRSREAWAVDSFAGMAEPTVRDFGPDGANAYPAGRFDVGGPDGLTARLAADGITCARVFDGFIPAVLAMLPDAPVAFAHVDLDHYAPTLDALRWVRARLSQGGVIVCDDWFPGRTWLASGAINDFLSEADGYEVLPSDEYRLALRRSR